MADSRLHRSSERNGPLAGVRVLDFTRVLSGPHATRMLSDMGADVIKVEPPDGDLTRFTFPRVGAIASYFAQQNVGKRNISVNLSTPEGRDLILQLIGRCDVVVENFRPDVMKRLGLDYESARVANHSIIYASISGYGATGPWVQRRAYAPVVSAETGMTKSRSVATGQEIVNDPHSHPDVYAGIEASVAVLAALYHRQNTGVGQYIDVSMAETMIYVNEHAHSAFWDREFPEGNIRSFQPGDYPVVQTGDGATIVISGHPCERGTFDLYCKAMNRLDLLTDERFVEPTKRLASFPALLQMIKDWASTVASAGDLEQILADAGLAMGVVRGIDDVVTTEWAAAREVTVEVDDRSGGRIKVPNAPWHFSETPAGVVGVPKFRGEDNVAVCSELLGMSQADIELLSDKGILSSRIPR